MRSRVQEQRAAGRTESLFRAVNERITDVADGATTEVLCECGSGECTETIVVSETEYEAVRDAPDRFLVLPSHASSEVERVVEDRTTFVVVEKIGAAAEVARDLDRR